MRLKRRLKEKKIKYDIKSSKFYTEDVFEEVLQESDFRRVIKNKNVRLWFFLMVLYFISMKITEDLRWKLFYYILLLVFLVFFIYTIIITINDDYAE